MFAPKRWYSDSQFRLTFVVKEKRKNADVLLVNGTHLTVRSIPLTEIEGMRDVDYGAREEKKMRASLRRLGKTKGTSKAVRQALKEVLG